MARKQVRTSDPKRLAEHLAAGIAEIADTAGQVGSTEDLLKIRRKLDALWYQLGNAASQVEEARAAVDEAVAFREPPQWDVLAAGEPVRTSEQPPVTEVER